MGFWSITGLVVLVLLAAFLVVTRSSRRLRAGRFLRLLRVSRLGAAMSASWLGAKVRRLFASKEGKRRIDAAQRKANAERLTATMGQMKGAIMKLGQMMSFVSEDLPEEYRVALASLQAEAPPMDFALVRDMAERELGRPLERAFAWFDEKPLASASIGQVHRARLPSGDEVVVKIQYPGVAEAIRGDLDNVAVLYRMMGVMYPGLEPGPVVEELRGRISEELDYALEARHQQAFHDLYLDHPYIRVPRVYPSHSTARVLTTEYVAGRRFAAVLGEDAAARSRWGEILYRFVMGSIFRFGVFNGDPHPGNYLFDEQGRMVFLDYGCVKFFPEAMRRDWKALLGAHLSADRERFRELLIRLSFFKPTAGISNETVYRYFGAFYDPFREDRAFTYTREHSRQTFRLVFKPEGEFQTLAKQVNMPRDFVFVNRIQWGVESILAQLEATGNWHQIVRELLHGEPPSTELGRIEAEYRSKWLAARGLSGELALTPAGTVALSSAA
jgi:predicted unusual protein kinase regulating ubiquinone biosynthesis (AarF/ABC1/UbiB family)